MIDSCVLTATYLTLVDKVSTSLSVIDGLLALILLEVERDTINAMPLIRGSLVSLTLEDVSKVTSAVGQLHNLRKRE